MLAQRIRLYSCVSSWPLAKHCDSFYASCYNSHFKRELTHVVRGIYLFNRPQVLINCYILLCKRFIFAESITNMLILQFKTIIFNIIIIVA